MNSRFTAMRFGWKFQIYPKMNMKHIFKKKPNDKSNV